MSPTQSRCRLKSLSRYEQIDTVFFSLMESNPTDEPLTIIGIFTLFFALETTLLERQFFRTLTKLIGWQAARRSAPKMELLEEECLRWSHDKYPGSAERVHDGLVAVFGQKGRIIITHHAEDGSGVGSTIITNIEKDTGLYASV
ncbi:hypothetical protein K438DRAFT_1842218 [Mycena galopus ATCC 62051]|nr:hypothetical protein K438DRAFT_1842218 [Mycena galopus ATCC 62051]